MFVEDVECIVVEMDSMVLEVELFGYFNWNYLCYVEWVVVRVVIYNVVDCNGDFYIVVNNDVVVYGDVEFGNLLLLLVEKCCFQLLCEYFNLILEDFDVVFGLNLIYDGMLVLVMMGGVVVIVD